DDIAACIVPEDQSDPAQIPDDRGKPVTECRCFGKRILGKILEKIIGPVRAAQRVPEGVQMLLPLVGFKRYVTARQPHGAGSLNLVVPEIAHHSCLCNGGMRLRPAAAETQPAGYRDHREARLSAHMKRPPLIRLPAPSPRERGEGLMPHPCRTS